MTFGTIMTESEFIIEVFEDSLGACSVWTAIIRSCFSKIEVPLELYTRGRLDRQTRFCRRQLVFANTNLIAFITILCLL